MASHPSDELAQRRARRDGANVVALDSGPVGVEHLRGRLTAAEREVAGLRARLDHTLVERDHLARLAETRKRQRAAAREREREVRDRLRDAERELADARERLVTRTASEAQLRVQSTGLHARIHALRAQAAGHDARVSALAALVDDLQGAAGLARAETEGHLAARERAERELTEARASAAEFEEEVAALRTELDALHDARDRTLAADERARVARAAELEALRQSAERLGPPAAAASAAAGRPGDEAGAPAPDLARELELAAERLRARVPEGAASDEAREGARSGEPREGARSGEPREGARSGEPREGAWSGEPREGAASGEPREGAASDQPSPERAPSDQPPPGAAAGAPPRASQPAPVVAPPVPAIPTVAPAKAVARAALRRGLRGLRGGRR